MERLVMVQKEQHDQTKEHVPPYPTDECKKRQHHKQQQTDGCGIKRPVYGGWKLSKLFCEVVKPDHLPNQENGMADQQKIGHRDGVPAVTPYAFFTQPQQQKVNGNGNAVCNMNKLHR